MESIKGRLLQLKMRYLAEKYARQALTSDRAVARPAPVQAPNCTKCNDAGYTRADVPLGHPQFGKPQPCSCKVAEQKARQQRELVHQSGIMGLERYRDAHFGNFYRFAPDVRTAFKQAKAFADCPTGWLVLTGPYGCGKTHLAVAIAKQRVEAGDAVLVQTVPDLLDQLRSAFSPKVEESFTDTFEEMRQVDLLVLDDYGAENSTTWAMEKLFQILNYRYNKNLPTVITSNNIHLDGIDPRVYSRMMDKNLVCLVKMEQARDYRIHGDAQEGEEE